MTTDPSITGTIVHHINHHRLSPSAIATAFKVAGDPMRLLSVSDYWGEFGEPIDLLDDPAATFAADEQQLRQACDEHTISYRSWPHLAFPVWLLREFYPEMA